MKPKECKRWVKRKKNTGKEKERELNMRNKKRREMIDVAKGEKSRWEREHERKGAGRKDEEKGDSDDGDDGYEAR